MPPPGGISYDRWWLFTWFVMVPVTIASGVNAWIVENEHLSHGPPPYIPYDHLTQRVGRQCHVIYRALLFCCEVKLASEYVVGEGKKSDTCTFRDHENAHRYGDCVIFHCLRGKFHKTVV